MDQAKWWKCVMLSDSKCVTLKKFYAKILKYQISPFYKRITQSHCWVWCNEDYYDTVLEFYIFCGKKKLRKIIEEAHLLGLEDELLIFERRN